MNFRIETTGVYGEWLISDGAEERVIEAEMETPEGRTKIATAVLLMMGHSDSLAEDMAAAFDAFEAGAAYFGPTIPQLRAKAESKKHEDDHPLDPRPILQCMADVQPRVVPWLWKGRIPLGRITLLVGRPGEGKSFLTTDLCARISTGTPWPDGEPCEIGSVLMICGEDDAGDTIRPRLDAHHADSSRIHILKGFTIPTGIEEKRKECYLDLGDLGIIDRALAQIPDCRLMIVDPIGSFLGGKTDAHRDNEVRAILSPIGQMAEKRGCAVLFVAHRRKSGAEFADDTVLGSRAFTGLARAVWHLSCDPENENRRLFLPGKNNLAKRGTGLAFSIGGDPAHLFWEADPVFLSADAGLAAEQSVTRGPVGRPKKERTAGIDWLRTRLSDGAVLKVQDLRNEAEEADFSWSTIQRAANDINVIRKPLGNSQGLSWELPKDE